MKAGLSPVEAKVALVKARPEDAVLQLCGDVPDETLSRMPHEWLYWRMCELEALRMATSKKVERLLGAMAAGLDGAPAGCCEGGVDFFRRLRCSVRGLDISHASSETRKKQS